MKTMCRTRQEIIDDEPDVQKLISLKEKLEGGDINSFSLERLSFEIPKLEVQIESTIREFKLMDTQKDCDDSIIKLAEEAKEGWEKHYKFHKKSPSLFALFRRSPIGFLSLFSAGLTSTSLLYVKETRDIIFSMVGMNPLVGQDLIIVMFPLFLVLLISGVIAFVNSAEKKSSD